MKDLKIKIGIELEGVLNCENTKCRLILKHKEDKHKIRGLPAYYIKDDGSIHFNEPEESYFNDSDSVEMTTKTYKCKRNFLNAVLTLKKFLDDVPLNQVIIFNSSCGCHVHFSASYKNNNIHFMDLATYRDLIKTRELFFNRINESKVLNINLKRDILTHYFRSYAQQQPKPRFNKYHSTQYYKIGKRRNEFNFISEQNEKGLEWRSINLLNVQTWEEMTEVLSIAYDCLMFLTYEIIERKQKTKIIDLTEKLKFLAKTIEKDAHNSLTIEDNTSVNSLSLPQNQGVN